ncbi:hypothetical protein [Delftia sp. PE138]|uniref:hypothetical protein n=1 Tax=Delftia sp. PE138 TaxID=1812483 RepID=UPI001BAE944E|nr:hypothetical protein [Delftia sp. PE138]MBS3719453.1 hypothetical protein [Delftia sp. PE138]
MTDIVTIPDVLPISPYPALGSTNFNNEAYAYATSVPPAVSRMREIAVACRTCAIAAQEYAQTAQAAASTATTQADAAMGYRNAAQASATAASGSATLAGTHASTATAALTAMQVLYLGSKAIASHPTTDNMGNPLQAGALYTNTGANAAITKRGWWWDGVAWQLAWGDITGVYMPTTGGTFTGPINVPAGATGNQAPRASEVTSRTATVYDQTALMSASPLNQWAAYISATGVGSDWPPGHPSVNAWDVIPFGQSGRVTQIASQAFSGNAENSGAMFVRTLHDAAWSPWSRMITDRTVMEREVVITVAAGTTTYAVDPAQGSVHYVSINGPVTFNLPAQGRQLGDQVTLRILSNGGVRPITLSSNAYLPVGQSLPTYAAGQIVTLTFFYGRVNAWDCFIGGVHQ